MREEDARARAEREEKKMMRIIQTGFRSMACRLFMPPPPPTPLPPSFALNRAKVENVPHARAREVTGAARFLLRLSLVFLNIVYDPVHVYRAFPGTTDCADCARKSTVVRKATTSRAHDERICESASFSRDSRETRGIVQSVFCCLRETRNFPKLDRILMYIFSKRCLINGRAR